MTSVAEKCIANFVYQTMEQDGEVLEDRAEKDFVIVHTTIGKFRALNKRLRTFIYHVYGLEIESPLQSRTIHCCTSNYGRPKNQQALWSLLKEPGNDFEGHDYTFMDNVLSYRMTLAHVLTRIAESSSEAQKHT